MSPHHYELASSLTEEQEIIKKKARGILETLDSDAAIEEDQKNYICESVALKIEDEIRFPDFESTELATEFFVHKFVDKNVKVLRRDPDVIKDLPSISFGTTLGHPDKLSDIKEEIQNALASEEPSVITFTYCYSQLDESGKFYSMIPIAVVLNFDPKANGVDKKLQVLYSTNSYPFGIKISKNGSEDSNFKKAIRDVMDKVLEGGDFNRENIKIFEEEAASNSVINAVRAVAEGKQMREGDGKEDAKSSKNSKKIQSDIIGNGSISGEDAGLRILLAAEMQRSFDEREGEDFEQEDAPIDIPIVPIQPELEVARKIFDEFSPKKGRATFDDKKKQKIIDAACRTKSAASYQEKLRNIELATEFFANGDAEILARNGKHADKFFSDAAVVDNLSDIAGELKKKKDLGREKIVTFNYLHRKQDGAIELIPVVIGFGAKQEVNISYAASVVDEFSDENLGTENVSEEKARQIREGITGALLNLGIKNSAVVLPQSKRKDSDAEYVEASEACLLILNQKLSDQTKSIPKKNGVEDLVQQREIINKSLAAIDEKFKDITGAENKNDPNQLDIDPKELRLRVLVAAEMQRTTKNIVKVKSSNVNPLLKGAEGAGKIFDEFEGSFSPSFDEEKKREIIQSAQAASDSSLAPDLKDIEAATQFFVGDSAVVLSRDADYADIILSNTSTRDDLSDIGDQLKMYLKSAKVVTFNLLHRKRDGGIELIPVVIKFSTDKDPVEVSYSEPTAEQEKVEIKQAITTALVDDGKKLSFTPYSKYQNEQCVEVLDASHMIFEGSHQEIKLLKNISGVEIDERVEEAPDIDPKVLRLRVLVAAKMQRASKEVRQEYGSKSLRQQWDDISLPDTEYHDLFKLYERDDAEKDIQPYQKEEREERVPERTHFLTPQLAGINKFSLTKKNVTLAEEKDRFVIRPENLLKVVEDGQKRADEQTKKQGQKRENNCYYNADFEGVVFDESDKIAGLFFDKGREPWTANFRNCKFVNVDLSNLPEKILHSLSFGPKCSFQDCKFPNGFEFKRSQFKYGLEEESNIPPLEPPFAIKPTSAVPALGARATIHFSPL